MSLYEKIKKEHLFIFIVLLTGLILFTYFDFGYTSLTVQIPSETCSEQGYSCCLQGTGKGNNYFSLDNTCTQGKQCWDYCEVSYDASNLVTGAFSFTDVFDSISNFFKKLFSPVGFGGEPPTPEFCFDSGDCPNGGDCISGICHYTLTVTKSGSGVGTVTSSPAGINCGTDCNENDAIGSTYTLTATASSGSTFVGWSGGGCSGTGTCTITIGSQDVTVTATFNQVITTYTLNLYKDSDDAGDGTVISSPVGIDCGVGCDSDSHDFGVNIEVVLTATADSNSIFMGWNGCDSVNGNNQCILLMDSIKGVTASFDLAPPPGEYRLTITELAGTGTGVITAGGGNEINCGPNGPDCQEDYTSGTSVTLTASANSGSTFAGWGGDCSGQQTTCTVIMSQARIVTATFNLDNQITYTLSVTKSGTGTGTVTSNDNGINCGYICSYVYTNVNTITLTATPSTDNLFVEWTGNNCQSVSGNTCTVVTNADRTVNAVFNLQGGVDTTPPTVIVIHSPTSPTNAQQVTFTTTASDTSGIDDIKIYVDNVNVKTCTSSPCISNPQVYSIGAHTYYATASDASSNDNTGRDPATGTKSFNAIPVTPTRLTTTPISSSQINLVWTYTGTGHAGFKIERGIEGEIIGSATGSIGWIEIGDVGASVRTYSSTSLAPNTRYYYRIRAYSGNIYSTYSSEANAITLSSTTDNQDPNVIITNPSNNQIFTTSSITVLGTANDNIAISSVKIKVNSGIWQEATVSCSIGPGTCTWSKQITLTSGSNTIQAQSFDTSNRDSNIDTKIVYYDAPLNDPPIASFIVTPTSGTTSTSFNVDASSSWDLEDATNLLQVRWDWENDGTWDTGYSTVKTASHTYTTVGTKTIKLEVKDTGGLLGMITNPVTVSTTSGSYTLTVNKIGEGNLVISSEDVIYICPSYPCNNNIFANTQITITATPDTGYLFAGWSGACIGNGTCIVTMNSAKTVTATFSTTPLVEICNNNADDDHDGAIDELDTDCNLGAYVTIDAISPTYVDSNSKADLPWEGSDINLRCVINVVNSDVATAKGCIFGMVNKASDCTLEDTNSDSNIDFLCNVGNIGTKNVSCNILSSCHADPVTPIRHVNYTINVTDIELCSHIKGGDIIEISDHSLDSSTYDEGDDIESSITVKNKQPEDNITVVASSNLYDINKRTLIISQELTQTISANYESQDYEFSLLIPNIDESKFKVYYKVYEQNNEDDICLQAKDGLTINVDEGSACEDSDDDGYNAESCGGNDCNDNDELVNPGMAEICTDLIDNDCNLLIDEQDLSCTTTICVSGETRNCNVGICSGTQLCEIGVWSDCLGGQNPTTEICNNNLDDDCDATTDVYDLDCGDIDSDGDGLPDTWELTYFGDLDSSGDDDYDNDGATNLEEYELGTDPTDDTEPGKPSILTTVLIVILVIVVAFILVWLFALRPKKPKFEYKPGIQQTSIKKPLFQQKETKVNPAVKEYVESSLRKGYTKEQIKKALLAKGWKNEEIDIAFRK